MSFIKLKNVLRQYKDTLWVQDDVIYKQVTISQTGRVSFRGEKQGVKIGRKRQFKINLKDHPDTLIFIRQGVFKGGIGICPSEVDECIVTENMPMFEIHDIEPNYLLNYLHSPQFKKGVGTLVPMGTAQKALHEKKLLELDIPYPDKFKQIEIVEKLENIKEFFVDLTINYDNNFKYISKLRQAILSEAVQGKLVPQDSNDEPAFLLLEKIKAEKEKLIKEKKIRKEKPLPSIKEEETPFTIPNSWKFVRLGNCVSILGDGIHGTPNYTINGEYYFINGNNLNDGVIVLKNNTKQVSKQEYENHKKNLNDRTILVSINGTIGNVAFYNNEKVMLGKSACYFNLFNELDMNYIKYLIKTNYFLDYAINSATGTTIKNVSLKAMRMLKIPLPPLNEQKRIVEKVNKLMQFCDQLESQIKENQKNSEALMNAVLREAFEV